MRNFIAVVFDSRSRAYDGLHALWELDGLDSDVHVHGTAVVHRDSLGMIQVDTKETHPALGTAVGVGIGALIGALAGPVGVAAGAAGAATIVPATAAALGAAAGGAAGVTGDVIRADTHDQALAESRLVIGNGQSAVIADVGEESTFPIDDRMRSLGGTVYRRSRGDLQDDEWIGFDDYLYPYEYIPPLYA